MRCRLVSQSTFLQEPRFLGCMTALATSQTSFGAGNGQLKMLTLGRKLWAWKRSCGRKQWRKQEVGALEKHQTLKTIFDFSKPSCVMRQTHVGTFSLAEQLRLMLQMSMSNCWRIVSGRKWCQSSEEQPIAGHPSSMLFNSSFATDNMYFMYSWFSSACSCLRAVKSALKH